MGVVQVRGEAGRNELGVSFRARPVIGSLGGGASEVASLDGFRFVKNAFGLSSRRWCR